MNRANRFQEKNRSLSRATRKLESASSSNNDLVRIVCQHNNCYSYQRKIQRLVPFVLPSMMHHSGTMVPSTMPPPAPLASTPPTMDPVRPKLASDLNKVTALMSTLERKKERANGHSWDSWSGPWVSNSWTSRCLHRRLWKSTKLWLENPIR